MTIDIIIRYLHFLGILTWACTLVAEWVILRPELSRAELQRLARIDGVYGLSAIVVVATGLVQWLAVGKPADFYTGNMIFYTKVSLAVVVGLLSIYPTVFFLRERKGEADDLVTIPARVRQFIRWELILLTIIPLLAALMANGVGRI